MSQFTQRINNDDNDGRYIISSPDWATNAVLFGEDYTIGIRFTNVTVPKNATITSAYLKFTANETSTLDPKTKIAGIAQDNTAIMTSDPTGRPKTTAQIDWDVTAVTLDTEYTSPDIKTIIQEIVDRAGWASGNAMGFLISDDASSAFNYYVLYDYSDDSTKAFYLEINYTVGSPSSSVSPSLSPSASASPSSSVSPSSTPSPSISPSASFSPSASASPSSSVSNSNSPSVSSSVSASASPSIEPIYYGLKIKKPSVNKNVEEITDPKELNFTSALGVLGEKLLDTIETTTDANGNIDVTSTHNFGYPCIVIVELDSYGSQRIEAPTEYHSFYVNAGETIEVTEIIDYKQSTNSLRITGHVEQYNHDTDTTTNISGRNYTFRVYYYFNEIVETY